MSVPTGSSPVLEHGHVRLILLEEENSSFYLDIPLGIIESLCLNPLKYLLFLGWCILGAEGVLARERGGDDMGTDGHLDEQEIFYYVGPEDADLAHAIDLEVIKERTHVASETTKTREDFRRRLLLRDPCCVWTGVSSEFGAGMHIIPHRRGSEWLQLIIDNRPKYSEDVSTLREINDIRNGVFAMEQIHSSFDPRRVVILKTPNHILDVTDVPPRHDQASMPPNVSYPDHERYTLQWLLNPGPFMLTVIPNNIDAAFKTSSKKPKPSDLLLHYNYGAAAVKRWGHGINFFKNRANPPRPAVPVPAPVEASRTTHDRTIAIAKRDKARRTGAESATTGARTGEMVESDGQALWDEDDVMLFCWGNSRAAIERHRKKVEETTQRMERWRDGVLQSSV